MKQTFNFDFQLLNQGFSQMNGTWNFGPICSSFTRIYYVTDGKAHVVFGGNTHSLTPGHIYLIPALTSHWDSSDALFSHYYIHCLDQTYQTIKFYRQLRFPFELPATESDVMVIKRLNSICPNIPLADSKPTTYDNSSNIVQCTRRFQELPMGVRMEVNGLLLQLVSRFFSKAEIKYNVDDVRIVQTLFSIEQNLSNPPSICELAQNASLCKDAFIRLFHRQTGHTPTDYIIRKRIQRAQMLFIGGNHSVKDVALSLGYDNFSYFSRLFKKLTNISPMEFIRQNR